MTKPKAPRRGRAEHQPLPPDLHAFLQTASFPELGEALGVAKSTLHQWAAYGIGPTLSGLLRLVERVRGAPGPQASIVAQNPPQAPRRGRRRTRSAPRRAK